jgi:hypothetical protein
LPNWKITRGAVSDSVRIEASPSGALTDSEGFRSTVLRSERRAVDATLRALRAGASSESLLHELGRCASLRVAAYDTAWTAREGSIVTSSEPVQALLFVQSAFTIAKTSERLGRPLAVLAAGLLGRLARLSLPQVRGGEPEPRRLHKLLFESALSYRSPALALLLAEHVAGMAAEESVDLGALLSEPIHGEHTRAGRNAERVALKRRAHDGID